MKKLLLLLFLTVCFANANAQFGKNFTETTDSLLVNLDKSAVTSGILYDRVFPFGALHVFNHNGSDTSASIHFAQTYNELYGAAYSNSGWLTPEALDEGISQKLVAGIVPIGLINYNFHFMDTLAVEDNLIYTSGLMFYDVPNRSRSPYILRNLTVAAALGDTVYSSSVAYQFPLRSF